MKDCLNQFFQTYHISPSSSFLLAVSGGVDSMVLLHLFSQSDRRFVALHCNFHLRGEESNRDQHFVEHYCNTHNIPLEVTHFDTLAYATEKKLSIEMAARELRYNWFAERLDAHQATYIVTGHHADDLIETILINLTRGTALKGLIGIRPVNGKLLRPLLAFSRQTILQYNQDHHIGFVEDSTNRSTEITRNKIRHLVVPVLKELNPSLLQTVYKNSQIITGIHHVYESTISKELAKWKETKNGIITINYKGIQQFDEPELLLYSALSPYGYNGDQTQQIMACLDGENGRLFYSEQFILSKERDFLEITPLENEPLTKTIDRCDTKIQIFDGRSILFKTTTRDKLKAFNPSPNFAYFDLDKLSFPLAFRTWKQGDYFYPIGKTSFRKKLSDFFKDAKFTFSRKRTTPLLVNQKDIIWVVGYRADNRYKINEDTQNILIVEIQDK